MGEELGVRGSSRPWRIHRDRCPQTHFPVTEGGTHGAPTRRVSPSPGTVPGSRGEERKGRALEVRQGEKAPRGRVRG